MSAAPPTFLPLPCHQLALTQPFPHASVARSSVFIDRDGRNFHTILNFLRTGEMMMPESDIAQRELLAEADFYQLTDLLELFGRFRFERELGALNLRMRERETEVRKLFAQDASNPILLAPHLDLIDVFANLDLFCPAHDESWQQLTGHMMLNGEHQVKVGPCCDYMQPNPELVALLSMRQSTRHVEERRAVQRSVCEDVDKFRATYSYMTNTRLDGFDMSNMLVAGGSVLASLLFIPRAEGNATQLRSNYIRTMK